MEGGLNFIIHPRDFFNIVKLAQFKKFMDIVFLAKNNFSPEWITARPLKRN
jgi:hypothetical protein